VGVSLLPAEDHDTANSESQMPTGSHIIFIFFVRLRRKTSFAANGGNKRRKPDNVEMQRLTEEQYDDDEIVMYEQTDNSSRT